MTNCTDYGRPERKMPSLHSRKFTPTPKLLGTAKAYFVCHIEFQISLIYAFIGSSQSVFQPIITQLYIFKCRAFLGFVDKLVECRTFCSNCFPTCVQNEVVGLVLLTYVVNELGAELSSQTQNPIFFRVNLFSGSLSKTGKKEQSMMKVTLNLQVSILKSCS